MLIHLVSAGVRRRAWERSGFEEYARRLPPHCALRLVEVPLGARPGGRLSPRALAEEGARMLAAVPRGAAVVALDQRGERWDSEALAAQLESWLAGGRDRALLVGGPDGLAPACRERAERTWSLSPLTLPHGLVRVLVAEAIYRAWSLLSGHPYHRG